MRIDPHKSEWQPIAQMLESGEYDGPESLAKAIVKTAYGLLLERDWYLAVVKAGETANGPLQLVYGLFASQAEAWKAELAEGPRMVLRVRSARGFERWVREVVDGGKAA